MPCPRLGWGRTNQTNVIFSFLFLPLLAAFCRLVRTDTPPRVPSGLERPQTPYGG